jgi:hypothetical protein
MKRLWGEYPDSAPVVEAYFALAQTIYEKAPQAASVASRAPMVSDAAYDGMLHAFTSPSDVSGGEEAWAFIPRAVLPRLYKLADSNYANLHEYYVDGRPVRDDVKDGAWGWISPADHIKYTWKAGKFVPQFDADIIDRINRTLDGMTGKQKGQASLSSRGGSSTLVPPALQEPNVSALPASASLVEADAWLTSEDEVAEPPEEAGPMKESLEAARPSVTQKAETDKAESNERGAWTAKPGPIRPYCGLYCIYSILGLTGQDLNFPELVKPEYFYRPAHQTLYRAIVEMRHANRPIDLVTLHEELIRQGHTIIIVTHDPAVARHCRRAILLRDGRVLGEEHP